MKYLFINQLTQKIFKRFYLDKSHLLSISIIVRSLDVKRGSFCPREGNEEVLGLEVPYLSAIGALIYLANNT